MPNEPQNPALATPALVNAWRSRMNLLDEELLAKPTDPAAWQWRIRRKILVHLLNRAARGLPVGQNQTLTSDDSVLSPLIGSVDRPIQTLDRAPGIETGVNSENPPRGSSKIRSVLDRLQNANQVAERECQSAEMERRKRLRQVVITLAGPAFVDPEPGPRPPPLDPLPSIDFDPYDANAELLALHRLILRNELSRIMDIIDREETTTRSLTDDQILSVLNEKDFLPPEELPKELPNDE